MNQTDRIVITGIGMVSGLGIGKNAFWENAIAGKSAIVKKSDWELEGIGTQYFGGCSFSLKDHFAKVSLPPPLRYSQLALLGCKLALNDAGVSTEELPPERVGLIINTIFGANQAVERYLGKLYERGAAGVSPMLFTKTVNNCALGDTTRMFNLKGPSSMLVGEESLCYGLDLLRDEKADVMVCGGIDETRGVMIKPYAKRGYLLPPQAGLTLSESLDTIDDTGKTILGEGSSFVVLERLAHAQQRGATIYAEVVGKATRCDQEGNHLIFQRSPRDLRSTMVAALRDAQCTAQDVGLVVGASCLPWQIASYELPVVREMWYGDEVRYTTIKGKTGETFGGASLVSLAVGALSLTHDTVPGTGFPLRRFDQHEGINLSEHTSEHAYTADKNCVLVNTSHVGGNITSLVLKKY